MSAMEETSPDRTQYLTFHVAGEEYAIGILSVKEIIEYGLVTRVPSTPSWIRGVINLRGSVVPVVDLSVKFGLPETTVTKWTCIVIVEVRLDGQPTVTGLVADSVSQVIELRPDEIEPPPAFGAQVKVDYLVGMGRAGRKFVMLLDIDRILSTAEILAAASLAAPAGPEAEDGAAASA